MILTTPKELAEAEETLKKVKVGIFADTTGMLERGYERCAKMREMVWQSGMNEGLGSNHQAEKREILRSIRHCETVIGFKSDDDLNSGFLIISTLETMLNSFLNSPEFKDYAREIMRAAVDFERTTVISWSKEMDMILTETERRLDVELQKLERGQEAAAA